MQINRHNYEEFFILYMDNELSVEERREVELFVQENLDLKAEFDLLLQSQLSPDDSVVFQDKDLLLKKTDTGLLSPSGYEEKLLSYIDNELIAGDKKEVEDFIAANPAAANELAQLKRVKLVADTSIVFTNKEILYREEEKVRVIGFNWKRIAIAAALLLAVSTAAFVYMQDGDTDPGHAAVAEATQTPVTPTAPIIKQEAVPTIENQTSQPYTAGNTERATPADRSVVEKNDEALRVSPKSAKIIKEKAQPVEPVLANTTEKKETNNLPQPSQNPYVNKTITDNPIAMTTPVKVESLTNNKETNSLPTVTPHSTQPLDHVITAASIEPVDEEQPGRKNKLRGFFRKVTRTFEKTTNIKATDDEDRLLLGGLAIKL